MACGLEQQLTYVEGYLIRNHLLLHYIVLEHMGECKISANFKSNCKGSIPEILELFVYPRYRTVTF